MRHSRIFRRLFVLSERDPSLGLDRFQSEGPIGGSPGKNNSDRSLAPIYCQRTQEVVDRQVVALSHLSRHKV